VITHLLESVALWIQGVISAMGYAGIAALMAIESACIPLPSEVIMPFAGSLVPSGRFTLLGCGLAGAIGCVVGSIPAYYLGAYGGRPLILKYGRYILLSPEHLDWADRFFARRGELTVFVARLLPVVRTFIAFPAGVARMPMGKFILYTFVGSFPWCLGLAWVGMKLGENIEVLKPWFHRFDAVLVAVGLVAVVWFVRKTDQGAARALPDPGGFRGWEASFPDPRSLLRSQDGRPLARISSGRGREAAHGGRPGGVGVVARAGIGCAHLGASRPDKPVLAAGKYAVESIRSRAQLEGTDQLIEISETGTRMTDTTGAEHVLTQRGALILSENGTCRLALAVSVDGEEPGISDRACRWSVDGDRFLLGDATGAERGRCTRAAKPPTTSCARHDR